VSKGIAFRDAHKITGEIVIYCEKNNIAIEELNIEAFKGFCSSFENDIYDYIDYENILQRGIKSEMLL
jgi:argininosuccinate lyase